MWWVSAAAQANLGGHAVHEEKRAIHTSSGGSSGVPRTFRRHHLCVCSVDGETLLSLLTPKLLGVFSAQAVRVDKIELAEESKSFHVHFGAGRLGLGLVLPALQGSKVPFAILQRPSREWAGLGNAEWQDSIAVNINRALYNRPIPFLDQTLGCVAF